MRRGGPPGSVPRMRLRVSIAALTALAAFGLGGIAASSAGAALPRPGYWEARIGSGGPLVRFVVAPNRRKVLALAATVTARCNDGHTHPIPIREAVDIPISSRGTFVVHGRFTPPIELDHPGLEGWHIVGRFTSTTTMSGTVSVISQPPGEVCTAPSNRRTWSGRSRANPALTTSPRAVHRRGRLSVRGSGYVPRLLVHVLVPTDVVDSEAGHVDQAEYTTRADSLGRFRVSIRTPFNMPFGTWRAQAWQIDCRTVCWVYSERAYRVTP